MRVNSNEEDPGILYHYTDARGVMGILKDGALYATDLAYLNDSRELRYGAKLAGKLLQESGDEPLTHLLRDHLKDVTNFNAPDATRFASASFCAEGDLLNQWRGYGGSGGFALGFDRSALEKLAEKNRYKLFPVVYRKKFQRELLSKVIATAAKDFDQFSDKRNVALGDEEYARIFDAMNKFQGQHYLNLHLLCAVFKASVWKEEHEWRLLPMLQAGFTTQNLKIRDSTVGLTPFVSLNLCDADESLPLSQVVIGPSRHPRLQVQAMQVLLRSSVHVTHDVDVTLSRVPLRWN